MEFDLCIKFSIANFHNLGIFLINEGVANFNNFGIFLISCRRTLTRNLVINRAPKHLPPTDPSAMTKKKINSGSETWIYLPRLLSLELPFLGILCKHLSSATSFNNLTNPRSQIWSARCPLSSFQSQPIFPSCVGSHPEFPPQTGFVSPRDLFFSFTPRPLLVSFVSVADFGFEKQIYSYLFSAVCTCIQDPKDLY